jgi:hypothetical protein
MEMTGETPMLKRCAGAVNVQQAKVVNLLSDFIDNVPKVTASPEKNDKANPECAVSAHPKSL